MALAKINVRIPEMDANFAASLVPVRETSKAAASFTSLCPDCEAPTKLNQKLICQNSEHGPYGRDEIAKGREVSKGRYVKVSDEEIAAVKESVLQANLLELSVFRTEQVEAATQPSGTGYFIAVADEGSTAKMLFDLVAGNPDKALVGELTLSKNQKMFRLSTWNNSLFLQELIRPTEIAAAVPVGGIDYKAKLFPIYEELYEEAVEDFDPTSFASKVRARMLELDNSIGAQAEAVTVRDVNNTTLDELEALLAAKKTANKTTKKAPARKKAA